MGSLEPQSNGPLYSNTAYSTLVHWAVTLYSEEGPGWAGAPLSPLLAVPNVQSTHQRPVYQLYII